jgi:5'-nucleotidase
VRVSLSDIDAELEPGTDAALLADGYATVTALIPICIAPDVDLPIPADHVHAVGDTDDHRQATG